MDLSIYKSSAGASAKGEGRKKEVGMDSLGYLMVACAR